MTDHDLRALLHASTANCPGTGRDCPDADAISALAAGTLEPARREAVLDRVATCASCAAALRVAIDAHEFARELAPVVAARDAPTVPQLQRRGRRAPAVFAMAASVLVAIGVGTLVVVPPTPEVVRGAALAAIEPIDGASLRAAPARLAWACPAASAATVEVLDATGEVVWAGPARECTVDVPASAREQLVAGDWLWQVRASDGTVLAGPFRFRIRG